MTYHRKPDNLDGPQGYHDHEKAVAFEKKDRALLEALYEESRIMAHGEWCLSDVTAVIEASRKIKGHREQGKKT